MSKIPLGPAELGFIDQLFIEEHGSPASRAALQTAYATLRTNGVYVNNAWP